MFEWVKQQGYYYFIDELYGIREDMEALKTKMNVDYNLYGEANTSPESIDAGKFTSSASRAPTPVLVTAMSLSQSEKEERPYFLLEPTFVLLAGAAAAIAYQAIDYPMEQVRTIFYAKETELVAQQERLAPSPRSQHLNSSSMRSGTSISSQLYQMTWQECKHQAQQGGGWRKFLFSNFGATAIRAVPAASVGFLVFEVMKRKLDARWYESEDREMASYLDQMMAERDLERRQELKAARDQELMELAAAGGYEGLERVFQEREREYEKTEMAVSLN